MSDEMAQAPAEVQTSEPASVGEPAQSHDNLSSGSPNDPAAFQADYTRKYQALASERQAFQKERESWEMQRRQPVQNPGYQPNYQQPQPQQDYKAQLIEQYGTEGANALIAALGQTQQQNQAAQFQMAYQQEELRGQIKFGKDWEKHTYFDPQTGQQRNRVMDYRLMVNPITGANMSIDEAWRLANSQDPNVIKQQIRDEVYKELNEKKVAQPAPASPSIPKASGQGHARTVREAALQAMEEHGY